MSTVAIRISNYQDIQGIDTYSHGVWRCYGWLLSLFGEAFFVQDGDRTFYLKRADLIKNLALDASIPPSLIQKSQKVQNLILEILNPVIGEPVRLFDIQRLFREFQNRPFLKALRDSKDDTSTLSLMAKQLEDLKIRHLTQLPYHANDLTKKLRPGDVIFKKQLQPRSHIVVTGQKVLQPLIIRKKDREGYKYSHVALYIGEGKIAEAVPYPGGGEVRILQLSDRRFALKPQSTKQYLVVRPKDAHLAKTAAEIAANIAEEVPPADAAFHKETAFKYTKWQAFRSVWHPSLFGPFARYRYLKQYIDDHRKLPPGGFFGLKAFFCSYFIGYCLQTAESRSIMPKLLGEKDVPLSGRTRYDNAIFKSIWAKIRLFQVWSQMSEQVQMRFDAKRLTPQDLRNFMVENRHLFQDQFLLKSSS